MSGSQRLMQAFFNWGYNLLLDASNFSIKDSQNKYLDILRQLLMTIDPVYFSSIPKINFTLKELQKKLCDYSFQTLGVYKEPFLAQDYLCKVTSLKIIIVFKLLFRVLHECDFDLKIKTLLNDDKRLLEHFIRSLDSHKIQSNNKSSNISSQKTIKKHVETKSLKQQNESLKQQLSKCYQRQDQLLEQNQNLKAQIQLIRSQSGVNHLNALKLRVQMFEQVIQQLHAQLQQPTQTQYYTQPNIPTPPSIKHHLNYSANRHETSPSSTIYYTPMNQIQQIQRNRTQSNVSNSTTAQLAKYRYIKLKKLHNQFQETMKNFMRT